jgi:ankyrin repeat protein
MKGKDGVCGWSEGDDDTNEQMMEMVAEVFGGYIKIVKELLKVNGILVNKGVMFGSHGFANALIWARKLDDTAMIKLLLKNGAKENDNEIG